MKYKINSVVSVIFLSFLIFLAGCNKDSVVNNDDYSQKVSDVITNGKGCTVPVVVHVLRGGYIEEIPEVMASVYIRDPNNKTNGPVFTDELGFAQGLIDCELPGIYRAIAWSSDGQRYGHVDFYYDGSPNQTIKVTVYTIGI